MNAKAAETVYLNNHVSGISVTNARIVFPGQTYALNGVTSVGMTERTDPVGGKLLSICIGALLVLVWWSGTEVHWFWLIVGITLIALGAWRLWSIQTHHGLRITTSAGEQTAFESTQFVEVHQIKEAIEKAIIERG